MGASLATSDRVIYEAAQAIRSDRGVAVSALLAQDDPRPAIAAAFASSDSRMESLFRNVRPELAGGTAHRLAGLRTAWEKVVGLRDELSAAGAKPRAERRLTDTKSWFDAGDAVVNDLSDLSERLAGEARIADPVVGELVLARQYAWATRAALGDECALVRGVVAAKAALTAGQRIQVSETRGAARQSLKALGELLGRAGVSTTLIDARAEAVAAMNAALADRDAAYAAMRVSGDRSVT